MGKKEVLRHIFENIVGGDRVDEAEIMRLFAEDYCQKVDGKTLDLAAFIAHMKLQKQHIHSSQTEFLALVEEGDTVFSNHIVRAVKNDGSRIAVQVIAQFVFDKDGKICLCDELTRLLQGDEADRDIGSQH
ncbi:MAG: nuclear transport factor 2 family protein [Neisseria sp.]|uniref:nuclear transport factor 2 family protein n=1 Tax=Neisseria sp. TaxID=192066 RepID=UPI0026DD024B|nr:nuclear transport factor 2 family protein [Neisseria sp.]MDO4640658.1 nuclear transport factor 2 family protein [Neisseria sp.]